MAGHAGRAFAADAAIAVPDEGTAAHALAVALDPPAGALLDFMAAREVSGHAGRAFAPGAALAIPDELAGADAIAVPLHLSAMALRIGPRIVVMAVRVPARCALRAARVAVGNPPAVRGCADKAVRAFIDHRRGRRRRKCAGPRAVFASPAKAGRARLARLWLIAIGLAMRQQRREVERGRHLIVARILVLHRSARRL